MWDAHADCERVRELRRWREVGQYVIELIRLLAFLESSEIVIVLTTIPKYLHHGSIVGQEIVDQVLQQGVAVFFEVGVIPRQYTLTLNTQRLKISQS